MTTRSAPNDSNQKAVVSVSEMASMCGFSRARFYELIQAGVMPSPCYDLHTRKPLYTAEIRDACLRVKMTNIGIDGRYVLFQRRRQAPLATQGRKGAAVAVNAAPEASEGILASLRALGMTATSPAAVEAAVKQLYPDGIASVEPGEVVRAVFRHLRRPPAA